jgi:hypothetical protein
MILLIITNDYIKRLPLYFESMIECLQHYFVLCQSIFLMCYVQQNLFLMFYQVVKFMIHYNNTVYLMAKLVFLLFYGHTKREKFIIYYNRPCFHTYLLANMCLFILFFCVYCYIKCKYVYFFFLCILLYQMQICLFLFFRVQQNKKSL